MEEYLAKRGHKLYPEEVVHHIDGDILNNDINNLEVFPNRGEHYKYHKKSEKKTLGINLILIVMKVVLMEMIVTLTVMRVILIFSNNSGILIITIEFA